LSSDVHNVYVSLVGLLSSDIQMSLRYISLVDLLSSVIHMCLCSSIRFIEL